MSRQTRLALTGPLGLGQVHEIRQHLLDALFEGADVVLDIDEAADPDLSFAQLILSARIHARSQGRTIYLERPASRALALILERAALLTEATSEDLEFWYHWKENA